MKRTLFFTSALVLGWAGSAWAQSPGSRVNIWVGNTPVATGAPLPVAGAVTQSGSWEFGLNAPIPAGTNTIGAILQGAASSPWTTVSPDAPNQYGGSVTSAAQIGSTIQTGTYGSIGWDFTSVGANNVVTFYANNDNVTATPIRCKEMDSDYVGRVFPLSGTPSFVCESAPGTYQYAVVTTYGSGTVTAVAYQRSTPANVPVTGPAPMTYVAASGNGVIGAVPAWQLPSTGATDVSQICGKAGVTVRVYEIDLQLIASTAAAGFNVSLVMRSGSDSGGTGGQILTFAPLDFNNTISASAVARTWTGSPTTMGTAVAYYDARFVPAPLIANAVAPTVFSLVTNGAPLLIKPGYCLNVNFGNVSTSNITGNITYKESEEQ